MGVGVRECEGGPLELGRERTEEEEVLCSGGDRNEVCCGEGFLVCEAEERGREPLAELSKGREGCELLGEGVVWTERELWPSLLL